MAARKQQPGKLGGDLAVGTEQDVHGSFLSC
jgi:hypothetical protein